MPPGRAKALLIVQVIIISTSKTLDLRRGWLRVGRVLSWGGGEERKVPAWDPRSPPREGSLRAGGGSQAGKQAPPLPTEATPTQGQAPRPLPS